MKLIISVLITISSLSIFAQNTEKLALTPPMGWNSWNTFQTNISEDLVKGVVDAFIRDGLKDAGYNYIVLDDGWMAMERDAQGNLVPDPKKFPSGLKSLSDYIHSKGLKFGIYNCAGNKTCGGYPGSRGHEYQDALMYASWGVDYLKYDWCNTDKINPIGAYTTMSEAIKTTKRPMIFSLCEWGNSEPWKWAKEVGQLWRTTGDIYPCFNCEFKHDSWSAWGVMKIANMRQDNRRGAGPGHWNDPDMLEVGNGMSVSEDRAHFALWCMMAAPLIMGNDVRKASKETVSLLTNKNLIAVDQDSLGMQGFRYSCKDSMEIWARPLANFEWAVCFINTSSKAQKLSFNWQTEEIIDNVFKYNINAKINTYKIKDLLKNTFITSTDKPLETTIPSHDVLIVRLSKK